MTLEPGRIPGEEPLAYYLTWTTYGLWLPGDERGWVAKPGQFRAPDAKRKEAAQQRMTEPCLPWTPSNGALWKTHWRTIAAFAAGTCMW